MTASEMPEEIWVFHDGYSLVIGEEPTEGDICSAGIYLRKNLATKPDLGRVKEILKIYADPTAWRYDTYTAGQNRSMRATLTMHDAHKLAEEALQIISKLEGGRT